MKWLIGGLICLIVWLFYKNVIRPQLAARNPAGAAPQPAPANPAGAAAQLRGVAREHFGTIALVVLLIAVLVWMFVFPTIGGDVTPSTIGEWSPKVWLQILLIWGIVAALVAIHGGGAAATLQKIAAAVALTTLVALPAWHWYETPSAPKSKGADVPRTTLPVSEWAKVTLEGKETSAMIAQPPFMRMDVQGGAFHVLVVFRDGSECEAGKTCPDSGDIAGVKIVNESSTQNIVSYAFKPM